MRRDSVAIAERTLTMACALLAAVLASTTPTEAARGQAPAAAATGSISGVVVSDDPSARPIARVAVTLRSGALLRPLQLLTDDAGRFAFTGLPAASFTIAAAKPTYLTLSYGQATPGRGSGLPIALEAGQQLRDLSLVLPRGAVISGRVVDDYSRPVANAPVQVMQVRTVNGERTLTNVVGTWPQTDARGGYRAYGLPPGDYIVCAYPPGDYLAFPQNCQPGGGGEGAREVSTTEVQWARQQIRTGGRGGAFTALPAPPSGPSVAVGPVFYPAATSASNATPITLGRGEERTGIDLTMTRSATARVTATILDADGRPAAGAAVRFSDGFGTMGLVSQDGRYVANSLRPGTYTLTARLGNASGTIDFAVDGRDLPDLVLRLAPTTPTTITLSGRVVFDGTTLPAPATLAGNVRVNLTAPRQMGPLSATTAADGTFTIAGIDPGRYQMRVSLLNRPPAGTGPSWQLKSAMLKGKDVSDALLDLALGEKLGDVVVTFTDRPSSLSGILQDATGRVAPGYYVVVFSTDKTFWRAGARRLPEPARVATDGAFTFTNLPAGTYHLVALTEVSQSDLYDEAFLEALKPSALLITLAEGEQKTQRLTIK
jgi:Carboxypeptidase regulatory-like domain